MQADEILHDPVPEPVRPAGEESGTGSGGLGPGAQPGPPARTPRNQHLKVDEPKSEQFTGRATVKEAERIQAAIRRHTPDGEKFDIVRLTLKMMDHIEDDWLQTFKTK